MHAPDMETGRLLYDDGSAVPCGPTAEKTQRGWRIAGLAAGRLDARLHIRQLDGQKASKVYAGDASIIVRSGI